jgi:uncharacterized membrane protein YedE/YeeE
MSSRAVSLIAALGSGLLFGAGLLVSGMTEPAKVLGFLDVLGEWDPSLLFVMLGAIGVHFVGYRLVRRRSRPIAAEQFTIAEPRPVDVRLLGGAAIFGAGWGLSGYCPGPAVVCLASGGLGVVIFVGGVVLGTLVISLLDLGSRSAEGRAEARG